MSQCSIPAAQDACPDKFAMARALLALLPRGRAWANNDGGPAPDSVLYRFWLAVGDFFSFIAGRACALRKEFFCATAAETADWWFEEYGLPDGCEPFPDPCAKILWYGAPRCASWIEIAARAGWAIVSCQIPTGPGAGCFQAGCDEASNPRGGAWLVLTVSLSQSPAFSGTLAPPPLSGAIQAGDALSCPPDLSGIQCLLARIVPAHETVILETAP